MIKLVLAACVLACISIHAQASTVYSSRGAWTSAVSGTSTVDFEGIAPDSSYAPQGTSPTIGGVTFQSSAGLAIVIGKDYAETDGTFCLGTACLFTYNPGYSNISIPGTADAFAFDFRGYLETSTSIDIQFAGGETFSITANNPDGAFFGVVLDSGVSSFSIVTQSEYLIIDDLSFGTRSNVPEPGSVALLGLALVGLAQSTRRRRKSN